MRCGCLLLHGLLHLSGMDHEVDGGEMAEREGVVAGEAAAAGWVDCEGGGAGDGKGKRKKQIPGGNDR